MKMNTARVETFERGVQARGSFKFELNGMAFHAVIDGIYGDKVRAPIREYCTNAYDAHLAAGKGDVPFDVQLPSRFDLTFRVRDYGIGMSHDEIMGLYSTMFASSKRDSNDQVGMIGLGSKSASPTPTSSPSRPGMARRSGSTPPISAVRACLRWR
jgi:hypothetical protein